MPGRLPGARRLHHAQLVCHENEDAQGGSDLELCDRARVGRARIVEDAGWLLRQIGDLTQAMEGGFPKPWQVTDAPGEFVAFLLRGQKGASPRCQRAASIPEASLGKLSRPD